MNAANGEPAQEVKGPNPSASGMWTEMTIVSRDYQGEVSSRTVLRSRNDDDFVDFSIEEYTGMSRRAKLCNVRLEGPAARAVYALLAEKFANTRTGD